MKEIISNLFNGAQSLSHTLAPVAFGTKYWKIIHLVFKQKFSKLSLKVFEVFFDIQNIKDFNPGLRVLGRSTDQHGQGSLKAER